MSMSLCVLTSMNQLKATLHFLFSILTCTDPFGWPFYGWHPALPSALRAWWKSCSYQSHRLHSGSGPWALEIYNSCGPLNPAEQQGWTESYSKGWKQQSESSTVKTVNGLVSVSRSIPDNDLAHDLLGCCWCHLYQALPLCSPPVPWYHTRWMAEVFDLAQLLLCRSETVT